MRIIVYWLIYAIIWGPLVRFSIHDRGLFTTFWWASSIGHMTFGGLWVLTCLDQRYHSWMMNGVTFARCMRSLLLVALAWECLEWFYDLYLLKPGQLPAQKGTFDTTSDVIVALFSGIIVWRTRHLSRALGLYVQQ